MDTKLPYWGSIVFSTIALVLLVINISTANSNRAVQQDVQQRQAFIASGQTFGQLDQALVQAMAEAAVKNGDTPMRDLLTSQGITLKNNDTAAADKSEKSEKSDKNEKKEK